MRSCKASSDVLYSVSPLVQDMSSSSGFRESVSTEQTVFSGGQVPAAHPAGTQRPGHTLGLGSVSCAQWQNGKYGNSQWVHGERAMQKEPCSLGVTLRTRI